MIKPWLSFATTATKGRAMIPAPAMLPAARQSSIALAAVCLSALMFGLEISSVPAILPTLEKVLQADFKQLQWIMNAYTIAVTSVLMATGTLADRYGRKRTFMIAIAAFGVTSLACGLTVNVSVLILARFLQGLSGGAMLICQFAVLSHQFREGRERHGIWLVGSHFRHRPRLRPDHRRRDRRSLELGVGVSHPRAACGRNAAPRRERRS
jgi:hypothetical protein